MPSNLYVASEILFRYWLYVIYGRMFVLGWTTRSQRFLDRFIRRQSGLHLLAVSAQLGPKLPILKLTKLS
jgi:hypothetical protein